MLLLSWGLTLNTMWQMIQLHECVPGTRFDRYLDLGRHAFGPRLGPWIVLPQQLIVQVGCDIVYMVTGGQCLKKFMEIACTNCTHLRQSYWILIFGALHFFLSQLPNFNSVAGVSLAAAIMSLRYVLVWHNISNDTTSLLILLFCILWLSWLQILYYPLKKISGKVRVCILCRKSTHVRNCFNTGP